MRIEIQTNHGTLVAELDAEKAPKSVENFKSYAEKGYYDGTVFHRVIGHFMIQGGGFDENLERKQTDAAVENEAANGLTNDRGTLAMARTGDPHSATSQFFINTVDNDFLNYKSSDMQGFGYCVFGKVVEGMDVVDKIREVNTGSVSSSMGMLDDVPLEAVVMTKVSILEG